MNKNFTGLVGRVINEIKIDEAGEYAVFDTDKGPVIAYTYAECCSHTWIEGIELPALGFPCLVADAENIDMPDLGDMPEKDYVQYYGCKISTDKGDIVIDYRNESNGYYGGRLVWKSL